MDAFRPRAALLLHLQSACRLDAGDMIVHPLDAFIIGKTTLPVAHPECGCLQTGRGSLVLHGHQVCPQGITGCIELCQLRLLPLHLVLRPNTTNEDSSQTSLEV